MGISNANSFTNNETLKYFISFSIIYLDIPDCFKHMQVINLRLIKTAHANDDTKISDR